LGVHGGKHNKSAKGGPLREQQEPTMSSKELRSPISNSSKQQQRAETIELQAASNREKQQRTERNARNSRATERNDKE
jgi:hypothetical protein